MTADGDSLASALVTALGELDELHRDKTAKVDTKTGGSYTYSYTDLASVLGYVRPILARHGLAVMQPVTGDGNTVTVSTVFLHRSGQERTFPGLPMPAGRTPQETGSAITYARRYSLLAALGLATDDDDGKAAAKAAPTRAAPRAKAAPKAAGGPSEHQTKHVMALFGKLGITDRDVRLARTSSIVGREVGSWNDVTADEADQVIDALRLERDAAGGPP